MAELEKPGRDPREQLEEFEFDPNVSTPDDLVEGMVLPGIVTNITNFGALSTLEFIRTDWCTYHSLPTDM